MPRLFDIFTKDDIKRLNEEWLAELNPMKALGDIATLILRHYNLRALDEIVVADDATKRKREAIITAFLNVQSLVITMKAMKTEIREHKKGDFIRDVNGDPIPTDDGKDYKKYTKDTIEKAQVEYDKPYYDYAHNNGLPVQLEKYLRSFYVNPDYDSLRAKYEKDTSYEDACEIIRRLTKYYIFDDPEKFVERFALLVANAKSKALGYQPKWGVLFSLVGDMGVGKSWLSQIISETYDETFGCHSDTTTYDKLFSRFNSQMATRGFLRIEEAAGLNKDEVEKIKDYITSPVAQVERKGMDIQTLPNLVTFFSTTNESVVANLVGTDKNRRVVEFTVKDKISEIPEGDLRDWLKEIWRVMPVRVPNENDIKQDLMDESSTLLDAVIPDVVYDIFKNHEFEVIRGQRLVKHQFKTMCVANKIQSAKVLKWCEAHGILRTDPQGNTLVLRRALRDLYQQVEEDVGIDEDATPAKKDIDIYMETEKAFREITGV